jgi:hypothetical protein
VQTHSFPTAKMPSYLSANNDRRSRSKSPGGRERDRSHSRDTRSKEVKKSSRKYDSPSESESDHRHRKSTSKKYYESESEDDRRRSKKSSTKYSESESEESDRHKKSSRSKKYSKSDSDDHRQTSKKSSTTRRDRSDSGSDRRKEKSKKSSSSTKKKDESESSGSEDINISIHRKSKSEHKSAAPRAPAPQAPIQPLANGYQYAQPVPNQYAQPAPQYAQPAPQYAQPAPIQYGAAPGFVPVDPRDYHNTRHGSYIDPRYPSAGAYPPGHSEVLGRDRTHSFSAPHQVSRDARDPGKQYIKTYNDRGEAQYVEVKPDASKEKKYREDNYDRHEKKYHDDRYREEKYDRHEKKYHDDKYRDVTPEVKKMEYLAIGGGLGASLAVAGVHGSRRNSDAGGKPPASPLLEAYRGTYQSISPMPSALVLHNHKNDSDLSDFDLSEDSDSSIDARDPNADLKRKIRKLEHEKKRHEKEQKEEARKHLTKEKTIIESRPRDHRSTSDVSITTIEPDTARKTGRRTVVFYDPEPDAKKIAAALAGTHKPANPKPLMQILPFLSSDDLFALRAEYKNHAKVGGAGINIAKHIKTRIPGNLGKVMYATALGRWESEAFWANSFYQGGNVRRELLIESLMGRSNSDIREIKNCFKDKKYGDDLEKCMKAELKADKFRTAILLALEERRGIEGSGIDLRLVQSDVVELHQALAAPSGGETSMIQIIVVRSDAHLREVLKVYEREYRRNFARDMIERSRNLVVCFFLFFFINSYLFPSMP